MNIFSQEFDRHSKRINYVLYPWLSLPIFIAAITLSVVFQPPIVALAVTVTSSLLAGVCLAYGPLSNHRWIQCFSWSIGFFPTMAVVRLYSIGLNGRFASLVLWIGFGLTVPFWIWRRSGLEVFRSSTSSHQDAPNENRA